MSGVTIKGLDALSQRFAAAVTPEPIAATLRDEIKQVKEKYKDLAST